MVPRDFNGPVSHSAPSALERAKHQSKRSQDDALSP